MVKIDLHTHPIDALKGEMGIKGVGSIDIRVAGAIVKCVKLAGLNGIAITEHGSFNHGWAASLEIMDNFRGENLVILPGAEIDYQGQQFLQIYVPDYYRRRMPFFKGKEWFVILAHPGHHNQPNAENLIQVDYDAVEGKSLQGDFSLAKQIASAKSIPITESSDAHKLQDIGRYYTELEYK
jgi:hypothetical protein